MLELVADDDACFTSMTNLLDFLHSSQNLHFVDIVYAGPRTENASPGRIVRLSNLSRLTLNGYFVQMILGHLVLLSTIDLLIKSKLDARNTGFLEQLLPSKVNDLENLHKIGILGFWSCSKHACLISRLGLKKEGGE